MLADGCRRPVPRRGRWRPRECPAASAAWAMSMPMPRPAPVMNQTLFSAMTVCPPVARTGWCRSVEVKSSQRTRGPRQSRSIGLIGGTPSPGRADVGQRMDHRSRDPRVPDHSPVEAHPRRAGLPDFGGRRASGLRREEVALLAGMSVEYYVRLERGNASGVSDAVLEGISRALKLDHAERTHLHDLVRAANQGIAAAAESPPRTQQLRPGAQRLLDAMTMSPRSSRTAGWTSSPPTPSGVPCSRRCTSSPRPRTSPASSSSTPRPDRLPRLGRLGRTDRRPAARESGRTPHDRELRDLIEELANAAASSRALGGPRRPGAPRRRQALPPPRRRRPRPRLRSHAAHANPGLQFVGFTAEPGSASDDALRLLGSLAARVPDQIKLDR